MHCYNRRISNRRFPTLGDCLAAMSDRSLVQEAFQRAEALLRDRQAESAVRQLREILAQIFINTAQADQRITTIRPRSFGVRLRSRFD